MDTTPWRPYAEAMWDHFSGKPNVTIVMYDDFERDEGPIAYWFREPSQFSPTDRAGVDLCLGRVLDVGAVLRAEPGYLARLRPACS